MEESEETLLRECRLGNVEEVQTLLEARATDPDSLDINCKGRSKHFLDQTALHLATYFGHTRVVELLLEHGADINAVNQCGDTPLHKAAHIGHEELVLLLLKHGASVSVVNGDGRLAAAVSSDPYISSLLRAAAGTERRLRQQRLLRAASDGLTTTVDRMLKEPQPPNINCQDDQGNTCLHVAAYRGHKAMAVLLLENGIDTTIRNSQGQLAVDLTRDEQMRQVLGVLPVRRLQRTAVRCEGPLVRRHRFTGWKPVWAVLERGVLTYFGCRADASSGVRRKEFRYLDGARVAAGESPEGATMVLQFNNGTMHRLRCDDGDDRVSRQKWMNALQEHIEFSSYYIRQGPAGLQDPDEQELLKPLGSMQDAMQSAKAQEQLLREHLQQITMLLKAVQAGQETEPHTLLLLEKLQATSDSANHMVTSLSHCLALFTQQEEVRQLQVRQERERCRVLEQSLHVLATEHHQLELTLQQSLALETPSAAADRLLDCTVTSEDEFFDADDDDTGDDLTLTSCSTPSGSTPPTLNGSSGTGRDDSLLSLQSAGRDDSLLSLQSAGRDESLLSLQSAASSLTVVSSEGGRYRRPRARLPRTVSRPAPGPGRTRLPHEQVTSDNFSVWSVLKSAVGKELTKITMPVVFNEPLSFLQRVSEYMEYAHLLQAADREADSVSRMQYVAAFAVSGLACNWERLGKPFNPLLGETFELHRSGFRMVCEQVSHHPPVSAFHAEADDVFRFHGSIQPKLKFWGRSVEIQPRGVLTVELPGHDEVYTWSNVNCCVHNVIVGKLWIEQYGTMEITNHRTGDTCSIRFKEAGWIHKELHRLEGFIYDNTKTKQRFLYGKWTDFLRSADMQSYEEYEKNNAGNNSRTGTETDSKTAPGSAQGPRGMLSMLNSISVSPFKAQNEAPAESPSQPEDGAGGVPRCASDYSIDVPNSLTLWEADPRPAHSHKYYHFTAFAMSLNELEPGMELCPTDCRLRPDIRALEEGNLDLAASEKHRLEEKQRETRKIRAKRKEEWEARYFKRCSNPHVKVEDWLFTGTYWDERLDAAIDIF
ncbi:oxysterol-binding protein-related protein 1-like [Amphibalanus amphitrite]|uniref:oxysterol-binding protein-related protein 1-like n=1 Tax=Amphibalanus amphitrite TaxID=1232801 RepID=UPI001C917AC8|nr:oxysterol-binding protein-related protein 1-like [Amphibalanus amphitrite]XP_043237793.1 oxysterol-binding protein-related protein 1-like [Amphibalanus amphitrite]XP_043237794.1 oxysterol-binding protein-related protein 1-like [Amphibalanus amphitrite]